VEQGAQAQMDTRGPREVSALCERPHGKLDPTDIMFSQAKKWAYFVEEFRL